MCGGNGGDGHGDNDAGGDDGDGGGDGDGDDGDGGGDGDGDDGDGDGGGDDGGDDDDDGPMCGFLLELMPVINRVCCIVYSWVVRPVVRVRLPTRTFFCQLLSYVHACYACRILFCVSRYTDEGSAGGVVVARTVNCQPLVHPPSGARAPDSVLSCRKLERWFIIAPCRGRIVHVVHKA